ncbi:hypothetical protein F7725_019251 [Dissostichus mawsoni]|uniref:Uncharacterized protein n=1 Tax=Dissostichus mawsoni TaxID=36200 RepID=A0A7J5YJ71_DISMA|nr:hypothetical protein F7725_019251 [Dissostichus mawsoni]
MAKCATILMHCYTHIALEVTEPVLLDRTVARQDVGLSEQNGDLGGEDCVAGGRKRRWGEVKDEPLQYVARHFSG